MRPQTGLLGANSLPHKPITSSAALLAVALYQLKGNKKGEISPIPAVVVSLPVSSPLMLTVLRRPAAPFIL